MEKKIYVTTERAGFVVAGRPVPPVYHDGKEPTPTIGFELELTDDEAAYELSHETIRLRQVSGQVSGQASGQASGQVSASKKTASEAA